MTAYQWVEIVMHSIMWGAIVYAGADAWKANRRIAKIERQLQAEAEFNAELARILTPETEVRS